MLSHVHKTLWRRLGSESSYCIFADPLATGFLGSGWGGFCVCKGSASFSSLFFNPLVCVVNTWGLVLFILAWYKSKTFLESKFHMGSLNSPIRPILST